MAFNSAFADAIASIESGGQYGILGPITKSGDRAYGKYQVMGANIPEWTREILGQPMSPEEFLKNPQAQDAVFQGKFGQYVEKFGPEGAAQAWFAGPGGVGKLDRKDQLGTSVESYGKRFMAGIGKPLTQPQAQPQAQPQPQPQAAAPLNSPSLPAFSWSPQQEQPTTEQRASPPAMVPLQIMQAIRQPLDLARLQSYLAQLPAPIRPYSFRG